MEIFYVARLLTDLIDIVGFPLILMSIAMSCLTQTPLEIKLEIVIIVCSSAFAGSGQGYAMASWFSDMKILLAIANIIHPIIIVASPIYSNSKGCKKIIEFSFNCKF